MALTTFDVRPLGPERLADFINFFEQRAFIDNPRWQGCYCHFPHADHARIACKDRSGEQNRAATCARIGTGTMNGWLGYANGVAVGWCNAGPRRDIAGLFNAPEPLADQIGAIACFVIAPGWRRQGLATTLPDAACSGLAAQGFQWAEAYPRRATADAAASHYGPLSMYTRAGFAAVREDEGGGLTVRKRLAGASSE
jgi:GNAT superfamily N-acetyltransferase